jgi:hypothetical protein
MAGYYRLPKAYIKADIQLSAKGFNKEFGKRSGNTELELEPETDTELEIEKEHCPAKKR